jgi:hypothetical protein
LLHPGPPRCYGRSHGCVEVRVIAHSSPSKIPSGRRSSRHSIPSRSQTSGRHLRLPRRKTSRQPYMLTGETESARRKSVQRLGPALLADTAQKR